MLTLSNINELNTAKAELNVFQRNHPELFGKFIDMIYLTRALHFKYQYMGCLLMDEEPGENTPDFVYGSVLRLYKKEIQQLKNEAEIQSLKDILAQYKQNGYAKLSLLALGQNPETLVGPTLVQ
ncbi:hypothetical protein [Neobacillus mesonae]|uniref:Uncharacterized protein n=1 Tax=Neobacillus mesonae TaxID=1193713 RepID=A0A3Q9QZQ3_9BACI|nr:hypothetical protein [Neobacillus mesonae]AZU64142.1 hypothetical protein CHR53_24485 [Neobacillus mesonae]